LQAPLPQRFFDHARGKWRKISGYEKACLTLPCRVRMRNAHRFSFDSSHCLNHHSNVATIIRNISRQITLAKRCDHGSRKEATTDRKRGKDRGLHDGTFRDSR
jgi:hypothetical protein